MSVLKIAAAVIPLIVGDGVHDDSAGFHALFCGHPYHVQNGAVAVEGNHIMLRGRFYLSRGFLFPYGISRWSVDGNGSIITAAECCAVFTESSCEPTDDTPPTS